MANTKLPSRLLDTSAIPALNVTGDLTVDTTTLKVDSTNNRVGVGIASPDSQLHVHGVGTLLSSDSYFVAQIQTDRNDDGSNDDGILQFVNGSAKTVKGEIRWDESTNTFELGHGDNQGHLVIASGGNVGIGTASPTHTLNTVGASGTSVVQSIRNPNTSWSQYALTRYGTEGADFRYMDFGYYRGAAEGTRGLVIKSQADATLVTFLDNGNVGIGTDAPGWSLDVSNGGSSVQLQLGRTGGNAGTAWLGADAGGFHLGVGAYGSGNSVATPNGLEVRTDGAIYMGDRAANIAQINIGTQGKASGMEFYPYSSVGTAYSSWDLNLGANISPKLGTTNSGHQIMTSYTASGGSNLRVGFNQLAWQRWTPAELNGKAAHDSVTDKGADPMFQVTTDGHMRAPYSSAFRTYLSTERTTNGLINSGWTDTSSSGVNAYDRAGDFNTSNGRFTAPVDGVYHFDVMWDSNASQAGLEMHVTGTGHTEYNVRWEPTGRSDDVWESKAYSTSVQMDTGDYVELYAVHCSGTHPVHMGSGHWGFFAGHLVS